MQTPENTSEQPAIKTGGPPETPEKLDSAASLGSTPQPGEIGGENGTFGAKGGNSGVASATGGSGDNHAGADRHPAEAAKRGVGAPPGNMNNFKHGGEWLKEARQGLRSFAD